MAFVVVALAVVAHDVGGAGVVLVVIDGGGVVVVDENEDDNDDKDVAVVIIVVDGDEDDDDAVVDCGVISEKKIKGDSRFFFSIFEFGPRHCISRGNIVFDRKYYR